MAEEKTMEEALENLQGKDLEELLGRVKEAQAKISELKNNQSVQYSPAEVAHLNSLILRDMISLRIELSNRGDEELEALLRLVIKANVMQYGRLLNVDFTSEK